MKTALAVDVISHANLAIGRDLRKMREKASLSQVEVARKAKIRPEMLSRIESGHGNPTVATITKIVKALAQLSGLRQVGFPMIRLFR
jgi:predicted transcriptional regulator